jgi:hypothetical protein
LKIGIKFCFKVQLKTDRNFSIQQKRKEIPIPVKTKVYLFDLVNPEEFKNGGKPIIREMGPYVYK